MGYTLFSAISPDYATAARRFLPTWIVNGDHQRLVIRPLSGRDWMENMLQRGELLRDEVLQEQKRGGKLLALDADCMILRPLAGGFSASHALSIARWPRVNIGVMFFNLAVALDWEGWFERVLSETRARCTAPDAPAGICDQWIWEERLQAIEEAVCKLDEREWNYCPGGVEQWEAELPSLRDRARILHVKDRGQWQEGKIACAKRVFPKQLAMA